MNLISQVARPAEEVEVLIAESVAQLQRLWWGGGGWDGFPISQASGTYIPTICSWQCRWLLSGCLFWYALRSGLVCQ